MTIYICQAIHLTDWAHSENFGKRGAMSYIWPGADSSGRRNS
jgi:hypothetical protein